MMDNIVMGGFLTAISNALTVDSARNAVIDSVPKGTEKLNLDAFTKGYDFGLQLKKA